MSSILTSGFMQNVEMKHIVRDRYLTPEEATKYNRIREQVAEELPDLIARHHARLGSTNKSMKYFLVTAYNLFPHQRGERRVTNQFIVANENQHHAIEEAYLQHYGFLYCVNEMQRMKYDDPNDYMAWVRNHPDWEAMEIDAEDARRVLTGWTKRNVPLVAG